MWSLNTSKITGPKYAVYSINPKRGPVTGKTKITIKGVGYKQNGHIEVMFKSGSRKNKVQGTWVNDNECFC
jgi:dynein heavy chain